MCVVVVVYFYNNRLKVIISATGKHFERDKCWKVGSHYGYLNNRPVIVTTTNYNKFNNKFNWLAVTGWLFSHHHYHSLIIDHHQRRKKGEQQTTTYSDCHGATIKCSRSPWKWNCRILCCLLSLLDHTWLKPCFLSHKTGSKQIFML